MSEKTEGKLSAWEKMQRDMVYDDFDPDLFNRRVAAKNIFNKFNQTTDEQAEERKELLKQLFGSIGDNVYVEPTFKCEFGKNIYIGNNVYINFGAVLLDCSKITIGNDVLIGPNVGMYSANHSIDPDERAQGALIGGRITIEDKVWIAGDVKIMAGVRIGKGSVIGCGSIVTHNIPPGVVAAGNPCKVIRVITDTDKVGFIKDTSVAAWSKVSTEDIQSIDSEFPEEAITIENNNSKAALEHVTQLLQQLIDEAKASPNKVSATGFDASTAKEILQVMGNDKATKMMQTNNCTFQFISEGILAPKGYVKYYGETTE